MAKSNPADQTEPEVTETPIVTSIESVDKGNGIILLKTNAPDGETIHCEVNSHRHQGQVVGGLVWIRLTHQLGDTYTIEVK